MTESEPQPQTVTQADVDFVFGLLKQGIQPEEARDRLVARGVPEDVASTVTYNCSVRMVGEARDLLDMGLPEDDTIRTLQERGYSPDGSSALVHRIQAARTRNMQRKAGLRIVGMGLGGVVFALGVLLFIGNVTGLFRTFPMAGWFTMFVGGGIFAWGERQVLR